MRIGGDRPGPLRLDRVVELHLAEAALGVPVDRVLGLGDTRYDEAAARGEGALALDVARRLDVRADRAAPRDVALEARQVGIVVAHVARARDAACDLQRRVPGVLVGMHVEQARQQRTARAVDDRSRVLGGRSRGIDRRDAPLVHIDVGRFAEGLRLRVEHAHVPDEDRLRQVLRVLFREVLEVFRLRLPLQPFELRRHGLVAGDDHVAAADIDAGEERHGVAVLEPDVVRLQAAAQDGEERHRALRARGPDARIRELLAAQLTARQRGKLAARLLRRAHDDGARFRAAVSRQVYGRSRQCLAAALRGRLPARAPAGDRETLVEGRAVGRPAGLAVALEASVGLERDVLLDVRPAAVVAVRVADVNSSVVLYHGLLRAGFLAGMKDGVIERRVGLRGAGGGECET